MNDADAELRNEFEVMAKRAGLVIPAERHQAFFAAFKDFRRAIARLHRPRPASVEVASVFSVDGVRRGRE